MTNKSILYDIAAACAVVACAVLCLMFAGGQKSPCNTEIHRIIIDTDASGDDAAAIMLAAKSPNIKIEGVTIVGGNVPVAQAAKNALMTLEVAGCDAPVYIGSEKFLLPAVKETACVYGKDGMGDQDLIHPSGTAQKGSAVDYILDTINRNQGEIEIVALGPVTNLALAIIKDPVTMHKVKRIWTMGTAGFGQGNATPVAEFNVYKDALAYKILLNSGIPLTIIGLDNVMQDTYLREQSIKKLQSGSESQKFIGTALTGIYDFYSKNNGTDAALVPDVVAMAGLVWPDFATEKYECRGVVVTEKNACFGQVIFYKKDYHYDTATQYKDFYHTVITKMDSEGFAEKYMKAIK